MSANSEMPEVIWAAHNMSVSRKYINADLLEQRAKVAAEKLHPQCSLEWYNTNREHINDCSSCLADFRAAEAKRKETAAIILAALKGETK